jgi:hypothetical protein
MSTPIDRAAGALDMYVHASSYPRPAVLREAARDALSAALTNDADPDWLVKVLHAHRLDIMRREDVVCLCGHEYGRIYRPIDVDRHRTDAVRAEILGDGA